MSIQAQIIQLLKRLCRDHGTAVMLVTHDMGVIAETADRVAVMYAGRIVEIGPVADVIHRPRHPYTVGLMGSIPSIVDERERLTQIDGTMPRLDAIPAGCAFHPRCPRAFERCRARAARARRASATTQAACWLPRSDADRSAARWRDDRCVDSCAGRRAHFDVSPPWLDRVLERKPRVLLKAVDGVDAGDRAAARRWAWSASPAAASRRSRG